MSSVVARVEAQKQVKEFSISKIIFAASAGTMIEWYDFYIFGSLTAVIAGYFFPSTWPTTTIIFWLLTFAAGFLVRPFGALVFGRLGDLIGRKYTFLVTMTIMGLCTAAIGLMPTYATIGVVAPIILVILRLLQGLALGGEYGGAATYVAEHAPDDKRGYFTGYIQVTATAGLFISLMIILATRLILSGPSAVLQGKTQFEEWGWRIPFVLSLLLVAVSLYIRSSLKESPLYAKIKTAGKISKNPIVESFAQPYNRRMVLIALFGAVAGQAVIWYGSQFYALFFLQNILKVELSMSYVVVTVALVLASPFFVFFGWLSDRIGRKGIIMAGCLIGALTYLPLFSGLRFYGPYLDPGLTGDALKAVANVNPNYNPLLLTEIIFLLGLEATIVYGPMAAFLVELFPTKIRYTSLSLPYHLGNGWFGGLTPVIATALVAAFAPKEGVPSILGGSYIYAGLIFPIVVATVTFIFGTLFIKETKHVDLKAESMEEQMQLQREPAPAAAD